MWFYFIYLLEKRCLENQQIDRRYWRLLFICQTQQISRPTDRKQEQEVQFICQTQQISRPADRKQEQEVQFICQTCDFQQISRPADRKEEQGVQFICQTCKFWQIRRQIGTRGFYTSASHEISSRQIPGTWGFNLLSFLLLCVHPSIELFQTRKEEFKKSTPLFFPI